MPVRSLPSLVFLCGLVLLAGAGCTHTQTEPEPPLEFTRARSDFSPVIGRFFFLSDPDSSVVPVLVPGTLRVWLDDRYFQNDVELGAREAEVWLDPAARIPEDRPYQGQFHLLRAGEDYSLRKDLRFGRPVLELSEALSPAQVLAASYRQVVAPGDTVDVGSRPQDPGFNVQLKMLRPGDDRWGTNQINESIWAPVRRLELRNVYDLGLRNIDPAHFTLRVSIDKGVPDPNLENASGVMIPLIEVLGLDQRDNDNPYVLFPDGRVDDEYVDYERGLLVFPDLRPFDPSLTDILGNDYRSRSWPSAPGTARPDTLGWYESNGLPRRSSAQILADETVPEIYDYRPTYLGKESANVHLYDIEVATAP